MKLSFTIAAVILFSFLTNAQEKKPVNVVVINQKAYYPGGDHALNEYFLRNLIYSEKAINDKVRGNVDLSFYVLTDSSVSEITMLKGVGYGIDEEVVKLAAGLKFAPAVANGTPVKSNLVFSVPVLAEDRKKLIIEE